MPAQLIPSYSLLPEALSSLTFWLTCSPTFSGGCSLGA